MTEATRELLQKALALSPAERAQLVRDLSASLDDEDQGEDDELDPELRATLERRIRDLDEGRVKPIAFADVLAEAREMISKPPKPTSPA